MNPYRLPQHVVPTRYELRLEPDLRAFRFSGVATIDVTVHEPTSDVVLNAVELEVTSADLLNTSGSAVVSATVEYEAEMERCRLAFPQPLAVGQWRLRLEFSGILNDKLRGFYRSSFKDSTGKTEILAATQFEATDARRAFPCWDEPAFKAIFSTTLVIDPALTAISNTAIATESVERGKKVVRFHDTIRMSTYLVAFVVGRLTGTAPTRVGRTPLRVWAVPGKETLAAFGQEIGAYSLKFFEDYYALPYPGDKLDLLAIPDFASGAMENLGAITFRETALLIDPGKATHAELERIADVVAHENAHMWFGDLVTMSWWNGLWLNEAFATFMEMLAVDAWKPAWQRWTTFGVSRAAALAVDGLHSTRSIEYPVQAPTDADAMFDVLTYEKGASVLRMLEQHLGPDVFRDGVRQYLRAHAYANADTGDLWAALGQTSKQAVPEVMQAWIFRPGYPLISASLDKHSLVLEQRRFTYLPGNVHEGKTEEGDTRWQVPIRMRFAGGTDMPVKQVLLNEAAMRIELPSNVDTILINEGGHGFYRVRYSPDLLDRLLGVAPDTLSAIERFNIVNDAWAAGVAGLVPLSEYLALTVRFRRERDKNVWAVIVDSFHTLDRILHEPDRPALAAVVRDRLQPVATALGWSPRIDEDQLTRQLRADLLRALGTIGNDSVVQQRTHELYEQGVLDGRGSVDPNILPAVIAILAYTGDEARYNEYLKRFRSASTPQEERRYLYALTAFRSRDLVEQTLARTLNGEIRTQDAPFIIRSLLMTVHGRESAWSFVKANWDAMDRQFPKNGLRRMCEGIVGLGRPHWEQDIRRFFSERRIDLGGKTLAQYLEQLRIAVALHEREASRLGPSLRMPSRP